MEQAPLAERSFRPGYVFLQFLNPEISALYNLESIWGPRLYREFIRLTRYAVLIASRGIAIPASYLFEVREIDHFLKDVAPVRADGLLHFISPTSELLVYRGGKRHEYRDELPLFPKYEGDGQNLNSEGQLVWIPRVHFSASGQITRTWRGELNKDNGLWHRILCESGTRQLALPSILESAIDAIPDKLEKRAFIYRFAKPFLPFEPNTPVETELKLLISREYLKSYLNEISGVILVNTPLGDLDCQIGLYNPEGMPWSISWRSLADCFDALNVRKYIESLSWRDLLKLRLQPVFHWLLELVFDRGKDGTNLFEQLMTLSRHRAQETIGRHSQGAYDVVRDRIWRFHAAIAPILSSCERTELDLLGFRAPSMQIRPRRRTSRHGRQLTLLKDTKDIGIVIALPEEFRELRRQLEKELVPEYDKETSTQFYFFNRSGMDGDQAFTCVVTLVGSMGAAKAALITERLRARWNVRTIVNVGIAAALADDVQLGDVVVASMVDNYMDRSKAIDSPRKTGFTLKPAGEPFRSSREFTEATNHLEFANAGLYSTWQRSCSRHLSGVLPKKISTKLKDAKLMRDMPVAISGHVASGPTVGASKAFKTWLANRDRSYLALDMESGGVLLAVYEAVRSTESLILRGISDYGDERKKELDAIKDGGVRQYAMHNALHFLWTLIRNGAFSHSVVS